MEAKIFLGACVIGMSLAARPTFQHSWDVSLSQMMWVDFAMRLSVGDGAPNLTSAQTNFIATHYAIVSLEKCLVTPLNDTINTFREWSHNLKAINPDLKVLFYWNMKVRSVSRGIASGSGGMILSL